MTARARGVARSAKSAVAGLCAIAAAGVTASCFSERATAGDPTVCSTSPCVVAIEDFLFEPLELRVAPGMTVRWENRGALAHTSTSDVPTWDSGSIAPGGNFSRTFTAAGRFPYHCEPHPAMKATIVVE